MHRSFRLEIKLLIPEVLTPSEYFFGRDYIWNLFDVGLSLATWLRVISQAVV